MTWAWSEEVKLVQLKDNNTTEKDKNVRKISGLWAPHPGPLGPGNLYQLPPPLSRPHWKYVGQIAVNNVENILFLDLDIKVANCEKNKPALSRDSLLYTNLTGNNKYMI